MNRSNARNKRGSDANRREAAHQITGQDVVCCGKASPDLQGLSLELLVHIMSFLSLKDILSLETLRKTFCAAATIHLRTRKTIDFTEGKWYGDLPSKITDGIFSRLLQRCPEVEYVLGVHPKNIPKRQKRHGNTLSVNGVTSALTFCQKLSGIGTSNVQVLDAMLAINPNLEIIGGFRNRGGQFPVNCQKHLTLPKGVNLSQLILTGIAVPYLPSLDSVTFLQLRWVRFTESEPFTNFTCLNLENFIMRHCMGDRLSPLSCIPLMQALGRATRLERLELVRVPFPGGMVRHVVEDNWHYGSFRFLSKVFLSSCMYAAEVDLGYIVLTSAFKLEELAIQPSLTKDAVFSALRMAHAEYPRFEYLHLGYVDEFPERGRYTEDQLSAFGLPSARSQPATLSDHGMKIALQVFPEVRYVSVYNCPNLHNAKLWLAPSISCMALRDLSIHKCRNLKPESFCDMIKELPRIEYIYLEHVFEEKRSRNRKEDEAEAMKDGKEVALTLTSPVLRTLSLRKCGVAKLCFLQCPSLCYLSCTECKTLSCVEFDDSPLNRASFSSCSQLPMQAVINEICSLPANNSRILSLQTNESFSPAKFEEQLFSSSLDYHLCIMHDHGNPPGITTKICMYGWIDTITAINRELIDKHQFPQANCNATSSQQYPWGRDIYRIHGELCNGPFEFVTDFPWLRELASSELSLPSHSGCSRNGSVLPRLKNNLPVNVCLDVLQEEIAEKRVRSSKLHRQLLVLYLNTTEIKDIY